MNQLHLDIIDAFAGSIFDEEFNKFNPNHDEVGRFATGSGGGGSSTDYRGQHQPALGVGTNGDTYGASLDDVSNGIYPEDIYTPQGVNYYGTGYKALDKKAHSLIMELRGKPDAPVTIYRAIPKDATNAVINTGDWVTIVKEYAVQHGQSNLNDNYKILSKTVKAKEIFTSGDSWLEWGYSPSDMQKFNPNHDERGRFSSGTGVGSEVAQSILERVKANGGLSVKVVSGNEPTSGYMVAKGTTFGATVSASEFYDPNKGPKILADYAKKHKSDLINGKYYLGLWHNTGDGNVYLDVSENIQNRETAIHAGQSRDQISIWDVTNFAEIQTGGSGVTKQGFGSGRIANEFIGDDGFGNRRMGENDLGQVKKTRVIYFGAGLKPILKFNPYHDELGRFTTGSGYAQGGYTAEQTYRQNQMRGKGPAHHNLFNMIQNGDIATQAEKDKIFNSLKQIYEVKSKGITKSGTKTTVEIKLNDMRTSAGELKIKGDIIDSNTKQVIGGIVRTFTTDNNNLINVEHDYLAIHHIFREEYKGFGVGRKVIHNSEAYYANAGIHKITVGTAWDGARTWARAGFDWNPDYKNTNFGELLKMGINMGFHNNTSNVPKPIVNRYHRLMKAMSPDYLINKVTGETNASYLRNNLSGVKYHPMTNKNFPIPNDFATLGYKKGLKNWVGKEMTYDMRMKYQKIVNSEGYNIKTKPPTDRNKDNLLFTGSPRQRPVS